MPDPIQIPRETGDMIKAASAGFAASLHCSHGHDATKHESIKKATDTYSGTLKKAALRSAVTEAALLEQVEEKRKSAKT